MGAGAAGGRARCSMRCLGICVLAVLVRAAAGQDCPDTSALKQRRAGDTEGHFLSATMSWTHVSGNKVRFEIISTWRRKHYWPCKASVGFSGPDGWPGLGDDLTVVGLSTVSTGSARQEKVGAVSTKLELGDGDYRELHLEVTSFSIEEDWLMGVSYIEHEYKTPYKEKIPLYEIAGQKLHYVSSPEDRDSTQPFRTVPWTAEFVGCCRRFVGKADTSPNFSIKATVDLSNHVASPRLVLMPFIYMQEQGSELSVCALSAGGRTAMVRKNGGTINYTPDDNTPATFKWEATASSVSVKEMPESKDGRCMVLSLGMYQRGDRDVLSIQVTMGDAMVQGNYVVYVKGPDVIQSVATSGPFGCPDKDICEVQVSFGKRFEFGGKAPKIDYESRASPATPLEVRYVVATSTSQTSLLATHQGAVHYAAKEIDEDHAGLPKGASFAPILGSAYVTNVKVVFKADEQNTRPGVDQFISSKQRDYTDHFEAGAQWHEVENSNFNCLTPSSCVGGAHISVYIEKARDNVINPAELVPLAAITGIQLANPSQVADFESKGYHKLNENLLEQSDRGEIYIMYKKGSGPPVTDVSATKKPGYHMITASTSHSQGKVATVTLYVSYSSETRVSRGLLWSPCTGQDEEVIVCAAATAWNSTIDENTPLVYGTPMQCLLMDVVPTVPPVFHMDMEPMYQGYMGKELEIPLRFMRQDRPLSANEKGPSIRFGIKGDAHTQPKDSERVLNLLTGRTKTGARIMNADKTAEGLSPVDGVDDNSNVGEFMGFLLWTPSPYQGGWSGEICLDACVDTSACPAYAGAPVEVCSQTCFHVKIDRCKWALQGEDSFVEIAPRFQTNWLQLWFLNPMVGHPDHASALTNEDQPAAMVNIGRIYKPRWDDTMASVAERFGISVQRLIDLNADLADVTDDNFIKDGEERELCVIPDSCSLEAPSNSGKNS